MLLFKLLGTSVEDFFHYPCIKKFDEYQRQNFEDSFYIIFEPFGLTFLFELNDNNKYFLQSILLENCDYTNNNLDSLLGSCSLTFQMNKIDLGEIFDKPLNHGGGGKGLLGEIPRWIKYKHNSSTIHFQFSQNNQSIEKITIEV